jgi:LPS O-antigen subunit length determinant protein (WzzB/FepE family)
MNTDNHDPNPNPKIGYTKPMIEWRKNKVLHRLCMGWSQAKIAKELQLDPSTISLDVQFLKEKAREELQTHISERIPFGYNRAVTGINTVLKKTSEILEKAEDTKTKMECLKLQMELYRSVMSVACNRWRRNRASNETC